jgi:hypothetical protein
MAQDRVEGQGEGAVAAAGGTSQDQIAALVVDLEAAHAELLAALADAEGARPKGAALVGEWTARELLAHLGYWAGHAAEALHYAEQGRTPEFGEPDLDVDERNAVVARIARETDAETARQREELAYAALLERLRRADISWFEDRVAYGDSLEQVIRDDGADHYREHALDLRSATEGNR